MKELDGPTSKRIRDGDIPKESLSKGRDAGQTEEELPSPKAIRSAKGRGLGSGAERRRNGEDPKPAGRSWKS